jgi:diguanylate cyclase (GGDEF)-like protein
LDSAGAAADLGVTASHEEASQFALTVARDAERPLALQCERIAELERLALTDELTGLLNRRATGAEVRHALRYEEWGVLVYMEMDGFKSINNTYGHAAGDEVLRQVVKVLQNNVRDSDPVGRMGGDEFAILLSRTSWEDGLNRADSHRSRGQHHRQWLARAYGGVESQIRRRTVTGPATANSW